MSWAVWITIITTVFFIGAGLMIWTRYKTSFKNEALIVAEVGNSTVILKDKFKVVRSEQDYYEILFWHQKDIDTTSPSYDKWTLFARNKNAKEILSNTETPEAADKLVRVNKSSLARGCLFYKTSEGDIKPMSITKDGNLKVISQDNRAFAATTAKRRAERQKGKWGAMIPALVFGGTVLICGLLVVFTIIYVSNSSTEAIIESARVFSSSVSPINGSSGVPA